MRKLFVIIDGHHLHSVARTLGFAVDYGALHTLLQNRGQLVRAHYIASFNDTHGTRTFRDLAKWLDYNKYSVTVPPEPDPAHVAAAFYIAAFQAIGKADDVIIAGGASWYVPITKLLLQNGIRVSVLSSIATPAVKLLSDELRRTAVELIEVDSIKDSITLRR